MLLGISRSKFFRLLKNYDESIGPQALLPLKRGRKKGQTQLSTEVEQIIDGAIKKVYKGPGAKFARIWQEVRLQCSKLNLKVPSENSVTQRAKEKGERYLHLCKYGAESAGQKFGAKPGKKKVSSPLEIVQIDHTLVDCMLCDEETSVPLSRPWVTLLIDVYTRVVLGFYVAYHPPSALSVACALTHAVLPISKYLKALGRPDILHPFFGVPKVIYMDNAKEFRSLKFVRACLLHQILPEWRPLGRKHYGGHIERLIGTMMTGHVHFLPGTTMSNSKQKGKYASEKKSVFTIGEFTQWFAEEVAIYNYNEHEGLQGRSPAEVWASYYHGAGEQEMAPPMIVDPVKFRRDFMPEVTRVIGPAGIRLNGLKYWSPELKHLIGSEKRIVKYDPFSLLCIWVKVDGESIEVRQADVTADDVSYEEYLISIAGRQSRVGKSMSPQMINMREASEEIVKDGTKKTKKAKKKAQEAKKAYAAHTVNQLFNHDSLGSLSPIPTDIDFSDEPTIYKTEDC